MYISGDPVTTRDHQIVVNALTVALPFLLRHSDEWSNLTDLMHILGSEKGRFHLSTEVGLALVQAIRDLQYHGGAHRGCTTKFLDSVKTYVPVEVDRWLHGRSIPYSHQLSLNKEKEKFRALSKAQIGRLGELLVQQKLLEFGIDSSSLTTDSGIDLVGLKGKDAIKLQVKTCLHHKPAGGKGRAAIDWYVPTECPADYLALVYYEEREVWLFSMRDLKRLVNKGVCQKTEKKYHLSMYLQPNLKAKKILARQEYAWAEFSNVIQKH